MKGPFYSSVPLLVLFVMIVVEKATAVAKWYTANDGNNYLIEEELKFNWLQAMDACARDNLQLVNIDSIEKNNGLVQLLRATFGSSRQMWLGHHDEFNNAKNINRPFYSASTGMKIVFGFWNTGEPNNKNGEHCVHISKKDFKWNDAACAGKRFGYICEEHYLTTQYRNNKNNLNHNNPIITQGGKI